MPLVSTDPISDLGLIRVTEWSKATNTPVLYGAIEGGSELLRVTNESPDGSQGLEDFLATAQRLQPRLVVVEISRLTEEIWRDALDAAEGQPDSNRSELIRGCRRHLGAVAALDVSILTSSPELLLKVSIRQDWYGLLLEAADDFEADDDEEEDTEDPRREAAIERMARSVANDPTFAATKNQEDRYYVTRRLVGGAAKEQDLDISEIATLAAAIHNTEVKPARERELIKQIMDLKKSGATTGEIAEKLGMPAQRIKALVKGK